MTDDYKLVRVETDRKTYALIDGAIIGQTIGWRRAQAAYNAAIKYTPSAPTEAVEKVVEAAKHTADLLHQIEGAWSHVEYDNQSWDYADRHVALAYARRQTDKALASLREAVGEKP